MAQTPPSESPAPPISGPPPPHSPQQFCLRWNNYQANLTNVFDQLLQSESFVDVTLACDGHSVKAHKMVLSACSPYFQSLFVENPCQHPIVILKDIHWSELKAVVEFMYKGEINVSQEQIGPLLKVAETLKVRGLADVNGEQEMARAAEVSRKKRRRSSDADGDDMTASSPMERAPLELVTTSPGSPHPLLALPPPPPLPSSAGPADDMEIKPGIAEMIREEERLGRSDSLEPLDHRYFSNSSLLQKLGRSDRQDQLDHRFFSDSALWAKNAANRTGRPAWMSTINRCSFPYEAKMLESSHAWLGASTSSLTADSYQYQLQSMWQKCWNTNQSLVHNLRFRERGPLKSWRPETMAEAILSVLKEGLSLSQAARKYDIPYPTFVLYANRVHNMLGPSADGGSDLRPKGRGRPQRILLGIWPEEHIRGVIRAVVFRDPQHMKDESYTRIHTPTTAYLKPETARPATDYTVNEPLNFGTNTNNDPLDFAARPAAPAAAAMVAVAQGLRQQMLAHHDHHMPSPAPPYMPGNHLAPSPLPSPVESSPTGSPNTTMAHQVEHKLPHSYQPGNVSGGGGSSGGVGGGITPGEVGSGGGVSQGGAGQGNIAQGGVGQGGNGQGGAGQGGVGQGQGGAGQGGPGQGGPGQGGPGQGGPGQGGPGQGGVGQGVGQAVGQGGVGQGGMGQGGGLGQGGMGQVGGGGQGGGGIGGVGIRGVRAGSGGGGGLGAFGGNSIIPHMNKLDARCLKNPLIDWMALKANPIFVQANMASLGYKAEMNNLPSARADHLFQDEIEDLVKRPRSNENKQKVNLNYKPMPLVTDLSTNRAEHLFQEEMENIMKRTQTSQADTPKLKVSMGVSGVTYNPPCDTYTPVQTELFTDAEMEDLVKPPPRTPSKDSPIHLTPPTINQRSD